MDKQTLDEYMKIVGEMVGKTLYMLPGFSFMFTIFSLDRSQVYVFGNFESKEDAMDVLKDIIENGFTEQAQPIVITGHNAED